MLAEKVTPVEYEKSSALGKRKKANNVSKWHLLVSYKAEYGLKRLLFTLMSHLKIIKRKLTLLIKIK